MPTASFASIPIDGIAAPQLFQVDWYDADFIGPLRLAFPQRHPGHARLTRTAGPLVPGDSEVWFHTRKGRKIEYPSLIGWPVVGESRFDNIGDEIENEVAFRSIILRV